MKNNSQSKSVVKSEIFLTNYEISCLQELRYGAALLLPLKAYGILNITIKFNMRRNRLIVKSKSI